MTSRYVKVQWKNVEDSTPRLITVDESTVIDGDFIEALESGTKNKVVRVQYYEPSPRYLLLGLTNLLINGVSHPSLFLELTPSLVDQEPRSVLILTCLGFYDFNELVYDIVRSAWEGYWKEQISKDENVYTLFFTEDQHDIDQPFILDLIFNIMTTHFVQRGENQSATTLVPQQIWEN
jgi:hypothetical protein